jgi:hypothetical protein
LAAIAEHVGAIQAPPQPALTEWKPQDAADCALAGEDWPGTVRASICGQRHRRFGTFPFDGC